MRIEKAKGFVEENRVNGALNLSRSLGDLEYKSNPMLKPQDQMVTAYPEVTVEQITTALDFIIIACDGIWDCMRSSEAVEYVYSKVGKFKKKYEKGPKLSTVVENMLDSICAEDIAQSGGIGTDNMTAMVIEFKK